jgi:hypothetical protein
MMTTSTIQNVIEVLNSHSPNILAVQKWMLMAQVQRAAKLGNVDAKRFVQLCDFNVLAASKN